MWPRLLLLLGAASRAAAADPDDYGVLADMGDASYDVTSYDYKYSDAESMAFGSHECACSAEWIGDGECDRLCNTAACGWDAEDCFHDDDGCHSSPTGADYRGNISTTRDGLQCQAWDSQWPNTHTYQAENYPDSHLGGHNSCRNPEPEDGSTSPWCIVDSWESVWGYCDIGPPSATPCSNARSTAIKNHTALALGEWRRDSVYEHRYNYYAVALPAGLAGLQVVIVPLSGDPNLYLSFDVPFPSGHNYTYVQDDAAVDVFRMTSGTYGYCGTDGYRDGATPKACTLYVSAMGHESSEYAIAVLDTAAAAGTACAEGCSWKQLGDGVCQTRCNNTACFDDRGDCAGDGYAELGWSDGPRCRADCHASWRGDGYCDAACFSAACEWDGGDCHGDGCADGCQTRLLTNGECDAVCNVESCEWDGGECYHDHVECYRRSDGADYRGSVSHTSSGNACQRWSDQFPNVHTRTHAKYPASGLGGHNYCRNPDGEERPWCYPVGESSLVPRMEYCDVGAPSESCPPPPPSPPPRGAPNPPPPPRRRRKCAAACKASAGDGVCDSSCNSTACLWDKGDCRSIVDALLDQARLGGLDLGDDAMAQVAAVLRGGDAAHAWRYALIGGSAALLAAVAATVVVRARRRKAAGSKGMYSFGENVEMAEAGDE